MPEISACAARPTRPKCSEAQSELGYILNDIADENAGVVADLREECDTRLAAITDKREAQS
ncbi:MAG: hypothetical protein AB7U61_09480 [Methylocystis sp.]